MVRRNNMNVELDDEYRFIRLKQVIFMTSVPKATLQEMIKKKTFPGPVVLSSRSRAWVESEVRAWMRERIAERDKKNKSADKQ